MKALIKTAPGQGNIELKQIAIPAPGSKDVLIKVIYAGVCGTDVHIQYDMFANSPPFILGHEFSGITAIRICVPKRKPWAFIPTDVLQIMLNFRRT